MTKSKGFTLQNLIDQGSFVEVHGKLFHLGADVIKQIHNEVVPSFLEKFKNDVQRDMFINTLLAKIETFEKSGNHDKFAFTPLKALCLETMAIDKLSNNTGDRASEDLRVLRHETALSLLESASKLYQNLLVCTPDKDAKEKYIISEQKIQTTIKSTIENYGDLEASIKLAELSSSYRKTNFGENHPNTLQILLLLAELGTKSAIFETQLKCLNDAELAYNTICQNTIQAENAVQIKSLLNYMSAIYSIFGDNGKAAELSKEAAFLDRKFKVTALTNEEKSLEPETQEEVRTLILKKMPTDSATLKIKKLIQENILDPIQKAAAEAKWHKEFGALITVEYGVAGYIDHDCIHPALGEDFNNLNYKIALGLCFEAINIGIMSTPGKNPLVAAIFYNHFENVVGDLLTTHPEYFIDGHILRTTVFNAKSYSQELLGEDTLANDTYNKHFEKAIIPFLTKYLQAKVLTPLKELVSREDWFKSDKNKLIDFLSDEFLLKGSIISYSALGRNFAQIPENVNIARILEFKAICEGIKDQKETNLIAIGTFINAYPSLNCRIYEEHKEYYLNNSHIKMHCETAYKNYLKNILPSDMKLYSSTLDPLNEMDVGVVGAEDANNIGEL